MTKATFQVLLIEDNPGDALLISEYLKDEEPEKYELASVPRLMDGLRHLTEHEIDAVLLDLTLPDSSGLDTFEAIQDRVPEVPVVVLTGLDDETVAVQAVQAGAQDFLLKDDLGPKSLSRALTYAVERQQLRRAELELTKMKEDFIANVSHQLRTPVHSIHGFLDLLVGDKVADPEVQREFLTLAARDANRLLALVDDLLRVARMESGQFEIELQPFDLANLLSTTLEAVRPVAAEADVTVELVTDGALWIDGDPHWLHQAVVNLVENAIKFSASGATVHVRGRAEDGCAEVSVTDRGPGIPAELWPDIFTKFFQASTPQKRSGSGSGLGLFIAKQIVESHGGVINVTSKPGEGSTFWFTIPLVHAAADRLEAT